MNIRFLLIVFCISISSYCCYSQQDKNKEERHYYTVQSDIVVIEFDLVTNDTLEGASRQIVRSGTTFNLIKTERNNEGKVLFHVVKFWKYSDDKVALIDSKISENWGEQTVKKLKLDSETDKSSKDALKLLDELNKLKADSLSLANEKNKIADSEKKYISFDNNDKYYIIKVVDFEEPFVVKTYFRGFNNGALSLGALVVPLKIRPKLESRPLDFTTDFTLGTTVGYKMRLTKFVPSYFSLVGFFGVTTVNVDSLSTKGYVTETTKYSALTPAFGTIFEINHFQIGLVIGCDIVGGKAGANWVYNQRLWWSFGIGYQFFKEKD